MKSWNHLEGSPPDKITIANQTNATSAPDNNASLSTLGGAAIAKDLYVGGEGKFLSNLVAALITATTIMEGGVALSDKYLTKQAQAVDSKRLEGLGSMDGSFFANPLSLLSTVYFRARMDASLGTTRLAGL